MWMCLNIYIYIYIYIKACTYEHPYIYNKSINWPTDGLPLPTAVQSNLVTPPKKPPPYHWPTVGRRS